MRALLAVVVLALLAVSARADDTPIAVLDLRPVRSNGQTDLAMLPEAVKLSSALRERLADVGQVKIVPLDDVKKLLGPLYRVSVFDCRENPACLQRMMRKLSKGGIKRVVLGTYEVAGERVLLTLHGVETKSGAFTKVELFEAIRGREPDEEGAGKVMLSVADVAPKGAPTQPTQPEQPEGDQTDVLAPMPPPPPPPIPDRIQVLGWARVNTAIGLAPTPTDPLDAPYDRVTSHDQLFLAARYQRSKTYAATASGLLEWNVFDHRTIYEASLRELYVGAFWEHLDLRIGNQRIAWGKADAVSPNDVLNPRDLRDPILTDQELRRIPTFALRADLSADEHALQIVVQPFFVPDRYDIYGSNWAVVQPETPLPFRGFFHLLSQLFDPTLHDQVQQLFAQTRLPTLPSAGARYTYTGHDLDASLYYHYGYDTTPRVELAPDFANAIGMVDWTTATPSTLAPVLQLLDAGEKPFTATFVRRHHVGFDAVTTVGSFALKLDAAYETARVFYQPDLVSFVSPVAQGVATVEYQSGELGKVVLVEGIYQHLVDTPPPIGLIGYKQDTYGAALLARWTFFEVIEAEVHAIALASPKTTILQPQLAYRARSGSLMFAIGALAVQGDAFSLGGYFDRNDYAYALVKYSL